MRRDSWQSGILVLWLAVSSCQTALPQGAGVSQPHEVANDVSHLNPVKVRQVFQVQDVEQIRSVLARAEKEHLKVSISGIRHIQGQQTAHDNGWCSI